MALCFFIRLSIHAGAPYDRMGSIAPLYIILRTSCLNPQLIFALTECVTNLYSFRCNIVYMLVEVKSPVNGNAQVDYRVCLLYYFIIEKNFIFSSVLGLFLCYYPYFRFLIVKLFLLFLAQFATFVTQYWRSFQLLLYMIL